MEFETTFAGLWGCKSADGVLELLDAGADASRRNDVDHWWTGAVPLRCMITSSPWHNGPAYSTQGQLKLSGSIGDDDSTAGPFGEKTGMDWG